MESKQENTHVANSPKLAKLHCLHVDPLIIKHHMFLLVHVRVLFFLLRIYYRSLLKCQHMFYWTGQAACGGQGLHLLTKRPAMRIAQLFNSSGSRLSCKGVSSHHLSWKETVWSGSLLAFKDSVFLGLE